MVLFLGNLLIFLMVSLYSYYKTNSFNVLYDAAFWLLPFTFVFSYIVFRDTQVFFNTKRKYVATFCPMGRIKFSNSGIVYNGSEGFYNLYLIDKTDKCDIKAYLIWESEKYSEIKELVALKLFGDLLSEKVVFDDNSKGDAL